MRYVVTAAVRGIGPILCPRQYPRPDHLDPFTYTARSEAEAAAATLQQRFPDNAYHVEPRS